jgi:hypothetical protein
MGGEGERKGDSRAQRLDGTQREECNQTSDDRDGVM